MTDQDISLMSEAAFNIRKLILKTTHNAGCGHTGGSLSEADILAALYFGVMRIDADNPRWPDRDRFILSKGHSTPGYYSALAHRGFFEEEVLDSFDELGSILQGHPDMHKAPGIDMSSGSLGQGLSVGLGMALGSVQSGRDFRTFVLLGDGESQEGQVWEAALFAGATGVKGIVGITDYNKVQLSGTVNDTVSLDSLEQKWKAFGWDVKCCDGHDMKELANTLEKARDDASRGPVMVLAHTIKGKGVPFMEGKAEWHGKAPGDDEYEAALRHLETGRNQ